MFIELWDLVFPVPTAERRSRAMSSLPQGVVGGRARGSQAWSHIRGAVAGISRYRSRRHAGHALCC